jgi:uncharacterized membrane protein
MTVPLHRFLPLILLVVATPVFADVVTLNELPAPADHPVASVSNIAADGSVIGVVYPEGLVVRWSPEGVPQMLGGGLTFTLDNIMPLISKDGSAIATTGYFPGEGDALVAVPELWMGGTDWSGISGVTLGDASPYGVSYDGRTLVGSGNPAVPPATGPWPQLPWIWTAADGQVELALPADTFGAQAWAVSNDGRIAAGFAVLNADDQARHGVRWVDGIPQWIVDADSQHVGQALGCNSDCSVIVGAGFTGEGHSKRAWRWSEGPGVQFLDAPPGAGADDVAYAFESSETGDVVVGSYVVFDPNLGPTNHGFLWTAANGAQDITDFLAGHDIAFGGNDWIDLLVNAVTPDGNTLLVNAMDADYTHRRAVIHIAPDDGIYADGFEGIQPF